MPTTASPQPAGVVSEIALGGGLAGSSTTLVGIDTAGALHIVDLSASTDTAYRFRPRLDGRRGLIPTGSGVLAPSSVAGSSRLVDVDGSGLVIESVPPELRAAAEPGRVWDLSDIDRGTVRALDALAAPTGVEVSVPPGAAVVPDPAGGLLVVDDDRTIRYHEGEPESVAEGTLDAAGVAHLLVRRCGDARCELFLVERGSGAERRVPRELTPTDEFQLYGGSLWSTALVTLSPNGRFASFLAFPAEQYDRRVGLLDTETGEFLAIAPGLTPDVSWSPDGRFAFVIDSLASGILTALDITTGETVVVSRDLPTFEAVTVVTD